jgi:hypothetical protein
MACLRFFWTTLLALLVLGHAATAEDRTGLTTASVENARLKVAVGTNGLITVLDKSSGRAWRQIPTGKAFSSQLIAADPLARTLVFHAALPATDRRKAAVHAPFTLTLQLDASRPEYQLTFQTDTTNDLAEVDYPRAFFLAETDSFVLFPNNEGILLPAIAGRTLDALRPRDWVYTGQGPYMSCLGLWNQGSGAGMLMLYNTSELAGYQLAKCQMEGKTLVVPAPYWIGDKYKFAGERQLTFSFASQDGCVALMKRYRQYCQEIGRFKTLRQKAAENPVVDRAVGAPVFWLAGLPWEVLDTARAMKADGFERAIIQISFCHYAETGPGAWADDMADAIRQMTALGYVVSRYDNYRNAFPADPAGTNTYSYQYNTNAYPDACVRNEDGSLLGAYPEHKSGIINNRLMLGFARRHVPADLARFPYNGRFIDDIGSVSSREGVDWSPAHPLGAYGARQGRQALVGYINSLGLVTGTEAGNDYSLPWVDWLEGAMSVRRFENVGLANPGWTLGTNQPAYDFARNDQYRAPLYSLAHHDETVISWRYEDSFHRSPTYWPAKNLFCLLYGNPPLFYLTREYYYRFRPQMRATAKYVCPWTRLVGYDEMVSHRFVSADHAVQETRFSSGHGVVANFSPHPYALPGGPVLPALGYATFTGDQPRAYDPAMGPTVKIPVPPGPVVKLTENFEGGYCRWADSGASFDWMQYRGVTTNRDLVISGKYSFLAENLSPAHNHEAILRTTPYFVPLTPGATYQVSWRYRVPQDSGPFKLSLEAEAEDQPTNHTTPSEWSLSARQHGAANATVKLGPKKYYALTWTMNGTGRLVLDDLRIQKMSP